MNGLYPIIRRVRRPLVPLVEPVKVSQPGPGGADAEPSSLEKVTPGLPEAKTEPTKNGNAVKNKGKAAEG